MPRVRQGNALPSGTELGAPPGLQLRPRAAGEFLSAQTEARVVTSASARACLTLLSSHSAEMRLP